MNQSIATLAILLLTIISGCLSGPMGTEGVTLERNIVECNGPHCPTIKQANGVLHVDFRGGMLGSDERPALLLHNLTTSVTITGVLQAAGTGIMIRGVLCDKCVLRLENLSIEAGGDAVDAEFQGGALVLDAVGLQTLGGGEVTILETSEGMTGEQLWFAMGGTHGIAIRAAHTSVHLANVDVEAKHDSALPGVKIHVDTSTTVTVNGLQIAKHDTAIELQAPGRSALRGVEIECIRQGIWALGSAAAWDLQEVVVTGCQRTAIDAGGVGYLEAKWVEATGNRLGMEFHGDRLVLNDFTFADNEFGLVATWFLGGSARISNGSLDRNTMLGAYVGWEDLRFNGVLISGNGPRSPPVLNSELAGGVVIATYFEGAPVDFRGNAFEENQPVALRYGGTVPVDASESWWGSPSGPVRGAAVSPLQAVEGVVVTAPHRLAPL